MRQDLKYTAYAVSLGFSILPAKYVAGIPQDSLFFTRGAIAVWETERGWRVAELDGETYKESRATDFHKTLLAALEDAHKRASGIM